jgi:transcriptional regulator with XRE-family HTH domain
MTDTKFLANLGGRIKELRQKQEITQNELAVRCEFEKASMSRIESGKTNITVLTLNKISKALDVDMTEFFNKDRKSDL